MDQSAEVDAAEIRGVTLLDGQGGVRIVLELKDVLSTGVEGVGRAFVQVFDFGLIAVSIEEGLVPFADRKLESHAPGLLLVAEGVEKRRLLPTTRI